MSCYEKSLRFIMSFLPNSRYDPEIANNDILKSSLQCRNVLASRDVWQRTTETTSHSDQAFIIHLQYTSTNIGLHSE